jgi:lactate dehydrogenase-like 2-hydroxyacid dehydrogenase
LILPLKEPKILYYEILQYQPEVLKLINDNFQIESLPDPNHDNDKVLQNADVVMAPLGFNFDRGKIDRCPNLKIIASSTLRVPHVDVEYAHSKGIKVCHLGNQKKLLETITSTAELTWGLIIALTRRIPWAHKTVCDGEWRGRSFGSRTQRMLSAMSLGIVGLGRLGSLVASYGRAFGMKVYYYSPSSRSHTYKRCQSLSELASCSDIVSVHAHLKPDTEKLISREFIQAMKTGTFIVNTSRGELIDESALLDALVSGHLGGAALDVLAGEYNPDFKSGLRDSPLVKYAKTHDNLILTPHYGGATLDAWIKTQYEIIRLIMKALDGGTVKKKSKKLDT